MGRLRNPILAAGSVGALVAVLLLPLDAWSQFSGGRKSKKKTNLPPLEATANTIAGPAAFTEDRNNSDQNVIYEVFGGAAVDVCLTLQNRGRQGDLRTTVDGALLQTRVRPERTRTLCFETPNTIELSCSSTLCEAVWRIDAI